MKKREFWIAERCVIPNYIDPDIVRLDDGRYRMYGEVSPPGLRIISSSISNDGLHWSREPGIRIKGGNMPAVTRTSDGKWRMYFPPFPQGGYVSAISDDGLNWTQEEGVRLSLKQSSQDEKKYGVRGYVNMCVLRLKDESYRFYWMATTDKRIPDKYWRTLLFDYSAPSPGGWNETYIMSAHSEDGLHLIKDLGVRISCYDEPFKGSLDSPWILQLPDGTIRMYFSSRGGDVSGVFQADSKDGLEFKVNHHPVLSRVPSLPYGGYTPGDMCGPIKMPDGTWRTYYGHFLGTCFNYICSAQSQYLNPPFSW